MPEKPDHPNELEPPPTDEELAEAERLRAALEGGGQAAELARALSAAWSPRDLGSDEHARLIEQALVKTDGARRRRRVVRISARATAVLALAAAVALVVWTSRPKPLSGVGPTGAVLAVSRSTQPLFSERFPSTGGETRRIDRIAMARASDLRDNEFAKWGVR
jgi:hypothetical protein